VREASLSHAKPRRAAEGTRPSVLLKSSPAHLANPEQEPQVSPPPRSACSVGFQFEKEEPLAGKVSPLDLSVLRERAGTNVLLDSVLNVLAEDF
jgi:hypothetical protein